MSDDQALIDYLCDEAEHEIECAGELTDLGKELRRHEVTARRLVRENANLRARLDAVEAENAELQATFDATWEANMRGAKIWQEITGRENTLPDQADMVVTILTCLATETSRAERAEAALAIARRDALEQAAVRFEERHRALMTSKGRNPEDYGSVWTEAAEIVRALANEAET
jgi:hypothetical protein